MTISSAATFSPIAVLDSRGEIVEVNQAWKTFGDRNGLPEEFTSVGKDYITISQQADDTYGNRVTAELRRLLADEQTGFTAVYPCHSPNQKRWFRLYATTVSIVNDRYYLLIHQRLDRTPPSKNTSPAKAVDTSPRNGNDRNRSRLVSYSFSSNESATEGILTAFDAIGIDTQYQDTTLQDWIDSDVINALKARTSEFNITFQAWNYPVGLTTEKVIIYTPERSLE